MKDPQIHSGCQSVRLRANYMKVYLILKAACVEHQICQLDFASSGPRGSPMAHSLTAALGSPLAVELAPWRDGFW